MWEKWALERTKILSMVGHLIRNHSLTINLCSLKPIPSTGFKDVVYAPKRMLESTKELHTQIS